MSMDEAVEVLARVLANEELFRADCEGYGWNAETDSSDHFMPGARKKARKYLEAVGPSLMAQALREAATAAYRGEGGGIDAGECNDWSAWLCSRADLLES